MKEKINFKGIKDLCDRIGLDCQVIENGVIITDKRDIWEGVEFAVKPTGTIGKIKKSKTDLLHFIGGFSHFKAICKPSTEQAYIEQLKKEAIERFGEIQEGDRFELPSKEIYKVSNTNYSYDKSTDFFRVNGIAIYQSGKWATKIPKRIEVVCYYISEDLRGKNVSVGFQFSIPNNINTSETGKFLASQLEAYLNGEIE